MSTRTLRRGLAGTFVARHAPLLGPLAALVALVALFTVLAPGTFLSEDNLQNLLAQVAVLGVMATGLTFVLILGEIDLSVGNIAALGGVSCATFFSGQKFGLFVTDGRFPAGVTWISVLGPFGLAALLGWISSLLVNRASIPSFVATLGVYTLASGWAFYWSQGNTLYTLPPVVAALGGGRTGPVPNIVICCAVILLVAHVVLTRTRFGRYVFMTGANRSAAELSGVPVERVMRTVFIVAAMLSALAGMLNVGRLGSAQATTSSDLLLPAIATVVLGGTSLFGGIGGIKHTVIGLLIYGVLDNGLDQLDVDIFLKPYIRALFLIAALVFNVIAMRTAQRAVSRSIMDELDSPPAPAPAPAKV